MPTQEIVQHTTDFLASSEIHVEAAGAGVARFGLSGFDQDELCCGLVPLAHPLVDPLVAGRGRSPAAVLLWDQKQHRLVNFRGEVSLLPACAKDQTLDQIGLTILGNVALEFCNAVAAVAVSHKPDRLLQQAGVVPDDALDTDHVITASPIGQGTKCVFRTIVTAISGRT